MNASVLVAALAVAGLSGLVWQWAQRNRLRSRRPSAHRDRIDTVIGWPPEVTRVLTQPEREAQRRLANAFPNLQILAQVPLARFIRVPTRNSYAEWLSRVGHLCADLLICDEQTKVLAVVELRGSSESERSTRRHDRVVRVLREAGLQVLVWRQDQLPSEAQIRQHLSAMLRAPHPEHSHPPVTSRPMDLLPVAEIEEVLDEGEGAWKHSRDPVASGYIDNLGAASDLAPLDVANGGRRLATH